MSNKEYIREITNRDSHLDTKTFQIEVLSPVHIGSGREFTKGLDFTTSSDHTILYHMNRLFEKFGNDPQFLHAIEQGNLTAYIDHSGYDQTLFHRKELEGSALAGTLKEFMTLANGQPVMPGSSLKGAIRTALFANYFASENLSEHEYKRLLDYKKERAGSRIEQKLLTGELPLNKKGNPDYGKSPNYDLGRALRIGDTEFSEENLEVMNARVMNLTFQNGLSFNYGWKELSGTRNTKRKFEDGTSVSVIVLGPENVSKQFRISLDKQVFDHIRWPREQRFDWSAFADMMNRHAKKVVEFECDFLEDTVNADSEVSDIIEDLKKNVKNEIPVRRESNKISWAQQVGWGTGWHSKTGLHINDENLIKEIRRKYKLGKRDHSIFPKTRKIAPEWIDGKEQPLFMMGWVKITEVLK